MSCTRLHISLLGLLCLCCLSLARAAPAMLFICNAPESSTDTRYAYSWQVLRTALEATRREYGDFEMRPAQTMNEARQIHEMQQGSPRINTMVLTSRRDLRDALIPVRIPIDRGLLGFRVFLIRADNQARFDAIQSLDALRSIKIGQGPGWVDHKILTHSGLHVVSGDDYERLFEMLVNKRFDAFSRGVTEVGHEFAARKARLPDLAIEKQLLLYYPLPIYFWFPNTTEGLLRAERVEAGLKAMIADGTLQRMFFKEYGPLIHRLNLKQRRLFRLPNPEIGPEEPLNNAALWYDPIESDKK